MDDFSTLYTIVDKLCGKSPIITWGEILKIVDHI